jgi:hypothetical protein
VREKNRDRLAVRTMLRTKCEGEKSCKVLTGNNDRQTDESYMKKVSYL